MTSTVGKIPENEREWKEVLLGVAAGSHYADARRENLAPLSEDVVVEGLVERGATESAARSQLDIAEGLGDVEHVEGESQHGHVEGYVPAASERRDYAWALPGDGQGDAEMLDVNDDDSDEDGWEQYVAPNAEHPVDADRVTDVLNAAQEYFRAELEDIHRRGAKSRWGLTEDTIDEAGIGFLPEHDDLAAHLRDAGFDEQEMLATGLFSSGVVKHALNHCDDRTECGHDVPEDLELLAAAIHDGDVSRDNVDIGAVMDRIEEYHGDLGVYQWWSNRLTIPYFDDDGNVRYVAARETGGTDDVAGKYLKHSTNREVTHPTVDEPLFGAARLPDDPDEVVVTEGLTDVLAARQAGYAAFGPATTHVSRSQREACAEHVEDADDVYVVMDNDDPEDDADISPGLNGALSTAAVLRAHDVEASVGVLPRVEGRETDMADYLKHADGDDPLREILADARAPREFEEFDAERHAPRDGDQVTEQGSAESGSDVGGSAVGGDGEVDSDGEQSALFDLEISDVAGHGVPNSPGDRGPNPFLGSLNSMGRHFQVVSEEQAYDHHASVKSTYTPLTWLLCDAGERDPKSPSGELSDEEVFRAWVHAKKQGVIPADDRIPWRARMHIIREYDLMPEVCVPGEYAPEEVPESVWEQVVEVVEGEYGLDAGLGWV